MSQKGYGVTDKKCVCDGLNRVRKMVKFYKDYATDVKHIPKTPKTNKKAAEIVRNLLETLKPEDAYRAMGKDWVQKAKTELIACEREGEGCMMALEWIRAAIHEDQGLQAKLTCQKWKPGLGIDFVREQPYDAIRWAMYGLAGFGKLTEKDAVKTIKKALKKHTCV